MECRNIEDYLVIAWAALDKCPISPWDNNYTYLHYAIASAVNSENPQSAFIAVIAESKMLGFSQHKTFAEALREVKEDVEKFIEIDPNFVGSYTLKSDLETLKNIVEKYGIKVSLKRFLSVWNGKIN